MALDSRFLIFLSCFSIISFHTCTSQSLERPVPSLPCPTQTPTGTPQYFDVILMQCQPCTSPSEADSTGYNCVCPDGYQTDSNFGGNTASCIRCAADEITSEDGLSCIACGSGRSLIVGTGTANICPSCTPSNSTVNVEKDNSGGFLREFGRSAAKCFTCANQTKPNADRTKCERCSNILDTTSFETCECDTRLARTIKGMCFERNRLPNDNDVSTNILITNTDGGMRASDYAANNLVASWILCKWFLNSTSCQELANLCAAHYSNADGPCKLYLRDAAGGTSADRQNWPEDVPWLYYVNNADSVLGLSDISTEYSLKKDSIDNLIRMFVAVYTLNGTYLGLRPVRGGTIQLCPDTKERLNAAWSFGTAYSQSCDMNVYELMQKEMLFYDPYIMYSSDQGNQLYPVPVLVTNYIKDGETVNDKADNAQWKFTRRFWLVDTALFPGPERPAVLRYASEIVLNIKLITNRQGRINTPYLKITYNHVLDQDEDANSTVSTKFDVVYELNSEKFDEDFKIAVSVLGVLGAIYSCIQTWTWARRSGNASFPLIIIKFLAFCSGSLSNAFLISLVSISLWWLVFFKRQDVVTLLPITADQEKFYGNFVIIALVLKLVDVMHLFACQVKIDMFLMDWERPKSNQQSNTGKDNEKSTEAPVSIWRTYFVANEWNEIQTTRKICPLFQIFTTLLFLKVIGFENLCSKDRSSALTLDPNAYSAPQSNMFRFGIMAAIWVVLAVLQWLFFTLMWERFVEDKVRQFVDLCSMANISVFIMENSQFGYYIHGRSPHGIADTGMKEMFLQLKRETENLCAHRGLVANTDAQTFRMSLPLALRTKYDEIFRIRNDRVRANAGRVPAGGGDMEKNFQDLDANAKINKFLSDYIDHSLRDLEYTVKDKIFFESLLDAEFEQILDNKGIFYNDNGHSFDQVLFYGQELTLTTFEILMFGLVDMFSPLGFVFSAVIVYFCYLFLKLLRDGLGRKNLAEKTLVDERFLI